MSDLTWDDLQAIALSFDGYEYAGSFEACADVEETVSTAIARDASLVASFPVPDLRCALFFAQRSWRHCGEEADAAGLEYFHAIVGELVRRMGQEAVEAMRSSAAQV